MPSGCSSAIAAAHWKSPRRRSSSASERFAADKREKRPWHTAASTMTMAPTYQRVKRRSEAARLPPASHVCSARRMKPMPRTVWISFDRPIQVDLAPQPGDMDVDDVVERRRSRRFLPHVARQRLARHDLPLVPEQVLEQLELADRQLDPPPPRVTFRVTRSISRSPTPSRTASIGRGRGAAARGCGPALPRTRTVSPDSRRRRCRGRRRDPRACRAPSGRAPASSRPFAKRR